MPVPFPLHCAAVVEQPLRDSVFLMSAISVRWEQLGLELARGRLGMILMETCFRRRVGDIDKGLAEMPAGSLPKFNKRYMHGMKVTPIFLQIAPLSFWEQLP